MPWKECNLLDIRTEFVTRSLSCSQDFSSLCSEYGISTKTGYKWQKRFLNEGKSGLSDRSRRPKGNPSQIGEDAVCAIIRLKNAHPYWGPRKIRQLYLRSHDTVPSDSTFKRILDKAGLVQRRRKRAATTSRVITDVKIEKPNDMWTVDFKGWWRTPTGNRCEPLTVRDAYSRFVLAIIAVGSTRTTEIRGHFERLFQRYGLPKIIRSDNGIPFACTSSILGLTALSAWWVALGIRLDRIRPAHPQDNGAHERMHLDIKKELQGAIEADLPNHQSTFDLWREEYNRTRPHEALGMKTPSELYTKSLLPWQGTPDELTYDHTFFRRKVKYRGEIVINKKTIFISTALRGWHLGLRYTPFNTIEAWFDYLHIGDIDLETENLKPLVTEPMNQQIT
jgi:putative transposase